MENFTIFLICLALISAVFGGMIVILVVQNTAAKKDVPDKSIGKMFLLASLVGAVLLILYGSVHFGGGNNPIFSKGNESSTRTHTFWTVQENLVISDTKERVEENGRFLNNQEEYKEYTIGTVFNEKTNKYHTTIGKFESEQEAEYIKQEHEIYGEVRQIEEEIDNSLLTHITKMINR